MVLHQYNTKEFKNPPINIRSAHQDALFLLLYNK